MRRLIYLFGGICLVGLWGLGNTARAQPTALINHNVRRYVQRMAHATPSRTTRRRLRRYEPYIQYFSGLSYTRPGITVNADFVRALIAAESSARPAITSAKGAVGLMQILPETGRRAGRELYASGYDFQFVRRHRLYYVTARDLKDPAINILIGCYLLDRYNRQFGNNLARTVSAWNAGPHRVQQHGGTPPYRETLTLIGRVNAYYRYFRRLRRR